MIRISLCWGHKECGELFVNIQTFCVRFGVKVLSLNLCLPSDLFHGLTSSWLDSETQDEFTHALFQEHGLWCQAASPGQEIWNVDRSSFTK